MVRTRGYCGALPLFRGNTIHRQDVPREAAAAVTVDRETRAVTMGQDVPRSRRRGGKRAARLDHTNVAFLPAWQLQEALQMYSSTGQQEGGRGAGTVWMSRRICCNDRDFLQLDTGGARFSFFVFVWRPTLGRDQFESRVLQSPSAPASSWRRRDAQWLCCVVRYASVHRETQVHEKLALHPPTGTLPRLN
jgi:hypothetical protein